MRANLERTGGLFFSEAVLLALVKTGLPRQEAYVMVQRNALKAISEAAGAGHVGALPGRFRELLGEDADVKARLDVATLDACFDLQHHLRHVAEIMDRKATGLSPGSRAGELTAIFERGEVALVVDSDRKVHALLTKMDLIEMLAARRSRPA